MGWSQNDVCLKCNEGGNLLTCSGCPLVIHDGCMRCSAKFDELGNFYCPHCSFKRSVAELSQARKNVKLTRKALSIFMGVESKEHNNEADPERRRQSETGAANVSMSSGHCEKSSQEKNANLNIRSGKLDDEGKIRDAERVNEEEETGNVEGEKIQEEESETPLASNDQTRKENSETYEASTDKSGEREISSKDKDLIGEEDCENSDTNGGHCSTGHVRAKRRPLMSDSSCEDTPARKKHVQQSSPAVKCKHRLPRTHSAQVTNKSSDEEFDDSGSESSKWIHPKHPSVKLDNNIGNTQSRRVFWTEEEVEMLKAGVEKYLSSTKKNIPWRRILDFGRHVFYKTRAPEDLREKWKKIRKKT